MLQCNVFPGLPPDFLDAEVNLFLVPFMDSEAENENPPRAGRAALGPGPRWDSLPGAGAFLRAPRLSSRKVEKSRSEAEP